MQEEIILHKEHPSQIIPHLQKFIQPKVSLEYDAEFDAKITPLFLQRKYLSNVAMVEDNNSCSDPSNQETNIGQESSDQQDFVKSSLPELEAGSTREVSAISNLGSFYIDEESDSQTQFTVSEKIVEEVIPPVDQSIPAIFKRYYLENKIDLAVWNANPVLKKLLPILLEDQRITSDILLVPQRRSQELIKKVHLITLRILRDDEELMHDLAAHAEMFEAKDFKESHRALIVTNRKLFDRICNMSFFNLLSKKLHEETVNDIQKNLVDKFDVTDPDRLKKAFDSAMQEDGKRKRTFKKPFTVMENFWSLILYCNEFLFELPVPDRTDDSNTIITDKRNTIQGIKKDFMAQLITKKLTIQESSYPVKKSKGIKDLYFQAFLRVV